MEMLCYYSLKKRQKTLINTKNKYFLNFCFLSKSLTFLCQIGPDFQKANFYCGQIKLIYSISYYYTTILNWMYLLQDFRQDIEAHREIMQNLDRTGTYLKYFGRKQDTVYIKNLLISIKLRWKKLVRRTDEKGRLLQQAYKEDKRVGLLELIICTAVIHSNSSLCKEGKILKSRRNFRDSPLQEGYPD